MQTLLLCDKESARTLRKCAECPHPSKDPPEPGPAISSEQFTVLIHNKPLGVISVIARVDPLR